MNHSITTGEEKKLHDIFLKSKSLHYFRIVNTHCPKMIGWVKKYDTLRTIDKREYDT